MLSSLDLSHIARRAAAVGASYLSETSVPAPGSWVSKSPRDWVTEVDRNTEERIRELLAREAPGSTVVGEELGPEMTHDGLVWIVDPLDGTTNFLHRFPVYGVSIAAQLDGELVAGVVHDVTRGLVHHAAKGAGAFTNETRIRVSELRDPAPALIGTGFPFKHLDQAENYLAQMRRVIGATSGVRRAGSAALDLAWVAQGAFDGFWELELAPWDIAAGIVLIREAGGIVTDPEGNQARAAHTALVAGNPWIHEWLLETVNSGQ
jgi:myo-inositol-1(or 4)-monophosphatase